MPDINNMQSFLHYGASQYEHKLSKETKLLFTQFLEACRKELGIASGGFNLHEPSIIDMGIYGNGWSILLREGM